MDLIHLILVTLAGLLLHFFIILNTLSTMIG
jgi:hypothetical protein